MQNPGAFVRGTALAVLIGLTSNGLATVFPSGYEKARWGMSLDKIMTLYPGGAKLSLQNGEFTYGVVRPVAGLPTGYILFTFSNNRFSEVVILFPNQGSEVDLSTGSFDPPSPIDSEQIYSMLRDRLSTKYGSPDSLSKQGTTVWLPGNGDIVTLSKLKNNTVAVGYRKLSEQKDLLKGL